MNTNGWASAVNGSAASSHSNFSIGDAVTVVFPGSVFDGESGTIESHAPPVHYYVRMLSDGCRRLFSATNLHPLNAPVINGPPVNQAPVIQPIASSVPPRVPCSFCSTECTGLNRFAKRDWCMCGSADCNEAHYICAEWLETGGIDDSDALRRDALRKAVRIREAKRRY